MASRSERAVAALTALALLPVWLFRYFPTQDGPSHLYNAVVLARLGDPASGVLRQFFAVNARLFPNWTMYLVMAPLASVLPPLLVQQILLSICVVAIPAAVIYLQRRMKGAADASALLAVALAYSALFFLGFLNFVMGAALFLAFVGYWSGEPDVVPAFRRVIVGYALLALTYFTHVLPFAAALLSVALLDLLRRRWRTLVELLPAFALLAWDAAGRMAAAREYRSLRWHVRSLLDLRPFVFFGELHVWIARLFLVLIVAAMLFTRRRRPMFFVSCALFLLYCVMPWGYGAAGWSLGGWVNDRLLFLVLLTLPAWIEVPKRLVPALSILVSVHVAVTAVEVARFHRRMLWIDSARLLIRPHTTLARLGGRAEALHVGSYLALQQDVVSLDDYEAGLPDFPVVFRHGAPKRPPDYLLVWDDARVRNVASYRILYRAGEMRLFGHSGL